MTATLVADPSLPPERHSAGRAPSRFDVLWQKRRPRDGSVRGGRLPANLADRFDAPFEIPLRTDRPTVAVNFVSTLDGVVALDRIGATGGREISGGFEPDRFMMGLLRATADAVLVGAATVRASRTHAWTPASVHPRSAAAYAEWRRDLGLRPGGPATVIVTASGDLDRDDLGVSDPGVPVIVATSAAGAERLRKTALPEHVEVVEIGTGSRVETTDLLDLLQRRGFELVLSEGGPTLFGELLDARVVDELFLTIAPHVAGRSDAIQRLALVEGVGFSPADAPWGRLIGLSRADDHLFLRYDLRKTQQGAMS